MTESIPALRFGGMPVSFDQAKELAKMIAESSLAPKDYSGKPGNVLVAMQMGAEIGLNPMQAIQNIAVINGRPTLWGDAALALCQRHPKWKGMREWFEGTGDDLTAYCEIQRAGEPPKKSKFSVAMAKRAGLWAKQGPWQQYPARMLQMRARGFNLRDSFADALRGFNIAEEQRDVMILNPDGKPLSDDPYEGMPDIPVDVTNNPGEASDGPVAPPPGSHVPRQDPDPGAENPYQTPLVKEADSDMAACTTMPALEALWKKKVKQWQAAASEKQWEAIQRVKGDYKGMIESQGQTPAEEA